MSILSRPAVAGIMRSPTSGGGRSDDQVGRLVRGREAGCGAPVRSSRAGGDNPELALHRRER
jgi:hypothetical protein